MFWVPLCYSCAALVMGVALPRLERAYLPGLTLGIDPGAALALLSAIASGMMALTAIVFSRGVRDGAVQRHRVLAAARGRGSRGRR